MVRKWGAGKSAGVGSTSRIWTGYPALWRGDWPSSWMAFAADVLPCCSVMAGRVYESWEPGRREMFDGIVKRCYG